jgi:hypothetical protein
MVVMRSPAPDEKNGLFLIMSSGKERKPSLYPLQKLPLAFKRMGKSYFYIHFVFSVDNERDD